MSKTYVVRFTKPAAKQLRSLPRAVIERMDDAIQNLRKNPRPQGCKKLRNREGYRIRVGDYRIIYSIFDVIRIVEITKIGHRRGIYD